MLKPLELNPLDQRNIRFTGELTDLLMFPRLLTDISFSKGDCCFIRIKEDHGEISRINVYFADLSCDHSYKNLLGNIKFDIHLPTHPRDPPWPNALWQTQDMPRALASPSQRSILPGLPPSDCRAHTHPEGRASLPQHHHNIGIRCVTHSWIYMYSPALMMQHCGWLQFVSPGIF